METIGLRELNQNPSKAVARVRAGETIVVTDRGRPVLRLVPEDERPGTLRHMVDLGEVTLPAELGMPDLVLDLAPGVDSLSELLIEDRDKERRR
ncbi:type II toxin-antitoxin system prevent-host-death family antitoxin [Kribbella turkmenica]|uniref:Antitoxin n=1 Tax=Kribbella turkmenica TaxID=2530375 RepID=A0A4R4X5E9_9ACTN|nr:type II toxin-antitoxin system prevent-host-death family antitoxin [Kribbella turkmenica]TDD25598.1 type II toxin-antitoxin system prevent-host-death family antitoxin [Kribbella turkmenica]